MDTSETYVKMCGKAEEIQQGHDWVEGDYASDGECILVTDSKLLRWEQQDEGYPMQLVWLPYQDQLQAMVDGDRVEQQRKLLAFDHYLSNTSSPVNWHIHFDSWEQLWLAFVMKECYSKIWNGEDWVKQ